MFLIEVKLVISCLCLFFFFQAEDGIRDIGVSSDVCSSDEAPWYIVPANQKWYRNLLVARTLVSTLRPYKDEWEAQLVERGERELQLLAQLGHLGQTANRENKHTKKAHGAT